MNVKDMKTTLEGSVKEIGDITLGDPYFMDYVWPLVLNTLYKQSEEITKLKDDLTGIFNHIQRH